MKSARFVLMTLSAALLLGGGTPKIVAQDGGGGLLDTTSTGTIAFPNPTAPNLGGDCSFLVYYTRDGVSPLHPSTYKIYQGGTLVAGPIDVGVQSRNLTARLPYVVKIFPPAGDTPNPIVSQTISPAANELFIIRLTFK